MPALERLPADALELSLIAAQYRNDDIYASFVQLNQEVSMLHPDVLALLYHFSRHATLPVLELGAFTGGAAIALARGLADAGRGLKVVSVEMGGAYDHAVHATPDIVASFRRNLAARELDRLCELVVGNTHDAAVLDEVARSARYGCLLMDSDGHVEQDLALYGRLLAPGAMLVVDDYYSPGAPEKERTTRRELDALAARGALEPFGVYGWGTWFGRLA